MSVQVVNILIRGNNIDTRNFDGLIEQSSEKDGTGIVGTGSNTFIPLVPYIAENNIAELLRESGVRLVLYVPIEGGQAQIDYVESLGRILNDVDTEVVVQLNEFHGAVENGGKLFEQSGAYQKHRDRITGIVCLGKHNPDTYGKGTEQMTELYLTFDEVDHTAEMTFTPKQRLRNMERDILVKLASLLVMASALDGTGDGK